MEIYNDIKDKKKAISVTGLGYVGLPLALQLARFYKVIAFDRCPERIDMMKKGIDPSSELDAEEFLDKDIEFTFSEGDLGRAHFHIITVPTPIDQRRVPEMSALFSASESVGKNLKKGDYVVYESTVYPGCTEEDCVPILEKMSGLKMDADFTIGYSPERINPGDQVHALNKIIKVVSARDEKSLDEIARVYETITSGGIYRAPSIRVAEAAKVIENTQRDLNIAFVNELAIIFEKMGINTQEVLNTAATKWNFLPFKPGMVGGHCIGVDPYYLLYKTRKMGYEPEVILSGRRINDSMHLWVAKRLVQLLTANEINPVHSRVLIMGLSFKENVTDIRNSKVFDLIKELRKFGLEVEMTDPLANPEEVESLYGEKMTKASGKYDAVVLAVPHKSYTGLEEDFFGNLLKPNGIFFDLKSVYAGKYHKLNHFMI
nr:nucleotide sugar dehydrogenase [Saprospiraceae bacterium]